MVLYEYPFHEGIRTMLRLEHLFDRLGQLMPRTTPLDHHFALVTMFEIMDVSSRADLKSDLLMELEKHRNQLNSFRGNPKISETTLDAVVGRIDTARDALNQLSGKAGHALTTNEWLMSVRSRISIPGGTCEFDLPGYYAWQQLEPQRRQADLTQWSASLVPLSAALGLLLGLLRDTGVPQKVVATGGQFQQALPPGKPYLLMRVRIDEAAGVVPEMSGHRLMASVRLMKPEADRRLKPWSGDAAFELTLCA